MLKNIYSPDQRGERVSHHLLLKPAVFIIRDAFALEASSWCTNVPSSSHEAWQRSSNVSLC